ncbi:RNA-binding protein involved in heterochromatin assembly dri1-like [Impatiens glandulifera]|uniref:RNA-binding protein involved in heterochromatin assembly dri1-like n=1 Tax=Impatiens glandulifera TaxID=253017 RepID=UPI001FB15293|nr:RNA-binding protein involved in heterochromatin assembly dri1-like [Impatiens glandulifera]XP_047334583.1 RNA-binding protein involved in heterochromatin assembly dri1-like [Impatiens glandulifera]
MGDSGGREGDWACAGCGNRNYAFRSLCNRCKQPRLLVDTRTPADSKWLPRVGDWICSGCTNNNYASRDKCKKCGQPKEIAAMEAAIAMAGGASLLTQPSYFVRTPQGGLLDQRLLANGGLMNHLLPLSSNWPTNVLPFNNNNWGLGGRNFTGLLPPFANQSNLVVQKGWRNGDWICICGFHNYSSRAQCKKCNAVMPPALGMKRLASEEIGHDWDNKRLNAGQVGSITYFS